MEQKGTEFAWDAQREEAALLIAKDELTDQEIADKLDIGRTTLWRWKTTPEFKERIREHVAILGDIVSRHALGRLSRRMSARTARWLAMQKIIDRRAAEPLEGVPGGDTGLLVMTPDGPQLDAAILKAMNDLEKKAAEDCGQLVTKAEIAGKDGKGLLEGPMTNEQQIAGILAFLASHGITVSLPNQREPGLANRSTLDGPGPDHDDGGIDAGPLANDASPLDL